jgi:Tol biopolymer transport system component
MRPERWQKIEQLFNAALDREANQRGAFLAEACKGDEKLRREVESLLAQEKPAERFLESGAAGAAAKVLAKALTGDGGKSMIGCQLGSYQILSLLGAGGMGEVYEARDTKLGRNVAIKVLPKDFTHDPERLARFQREARMLAVLNHPNIATIHGLEESGGVHYLVMELVPGETLAARISKGALPVEEALRVAGQVAEALEAAHEKGVIHRDLKPANVKVTPEGRVKVLDFGLAKAFAGDGEVDLSQPPTLSQEGRILGTPAYMSPEQACGKPLDRRTDIWAFGVVLYEMLTGRQAFSGETASDTLAAVLKDEPEWDRVPEKAQRLLRRCLEKDPKRRLRDIADAMALVDEGPTPQSMALRHSKLPWAVAAVAVFLSAVGWWYTTRPAPLRPLVRLNAEIAADTPLATIAGGVLALSPDGARLALILRGADGKVRLYTRLMEQNQVTPLTGTENAHSPFFSPDGAWIGFFADGKLKKISVQGGAAVTLCDARDPDGASWGDDGNIVAALDGSGGVGLWRVPSSGGKPELLTKLNQGERTHRWPQVLPGSQAVLFTSSTGFGNYDDANIDVVSLKTGERKTVQRGGFFPRYLATSNGSGHLVYLRQSTLFAVPFDPGRLTLAGVPAPILEDVDSNAGAGGYFAFGGAPSGPRTFVYLAATGQGSQISWLDSAGKTQPLHAPPGVYTTPRFSPDGKRLAFSLSSGTGVDIWLQDLDRDTPSRLSFLAGINRYPVWTPDGNNIVFHSLNSPAPGLYWIRSDGSGEAQRLTDGKLGETPYSFSPDGKRLAFSQLGNGGSADIFTAPIESDSVHVRLGKPELFLGTPFIEFSPAFSPDGRRVAYVSNESGNWEVYVRPFPGPGGKWQISKGGGLFPLWSRDGRELLFMTLDRRVMAVSYTAQGDSFAADRPRAWSETRLLLVTIEPLRDFPYAPPRAWSETRLLSVTPAISRVVGLPVYDLAPDGKRLAAILASDQAGGEPTHLTFLLNFFDELRRRVPTGK